MVFYGLYPYWKENAKQTRKAINERRRLGYLKDTVKWELYERLAAEGLTCRWIGVTLICEGVEVKVNTARKRYLHNQTFYVIPYDKSIRIYAVLTDSGKFIFYLPYKKRKYGKLLYLNSDKEKKDERFPTKREINILKLIWKDKETQQRYLKRGDFDDGSKYGRFGEPNDPRLSGGNKSSKWPWREVKR